MRVPFPPPPPLILALIDLILFDALLSFLLGFFFPLLFYFSSLYFEVLMNAILGNGELFGSYLVAYSWFYTQALHSEATPDMLRGPSGVPKIKPRLASCKSSTLLAGFRGPYMVPGIELWMGCM